MDMRLSGQSHMAGEKAPLLSICIPTYNRARLFRICLLSILEQLDGFEDEVEVIVSDNCSSDDTRKVAEEAMAYGPFCYNRNKENIGAGPNFRLLSNELAQGEFCWLIGDDDFLRKGALSRLIPFLKQNPGIDYCYTNLQHIDIEPMLSDPSIKTSAQFPDDLRPDSRHTNDRELASFDELIDTDLVPVFLGAMQGSIFRRKLWVEASKEVNVSIENWLSIETTYPHAVTLAKSMRGRRVYYFGDPLLVTGDGARDWEKEFPMVAHVRLLELLDFYESLGVDPKQIRKCRGHLLLNTVPFFLILSITKDGKDSPVNYRQPIKKYGRYREFWLSFLIVPMGRLATLVRKKSNA